MINESMGDLLTRYAKVVKIENKKTCFSVSYDHNIKLLKKTEHDYLNPKRGNLNIKFPDLAHQLSIIIVRLYLYYKLDNGFIKHVLNLDFSRVRILIFNLLVAHFLLGMVLILYLQR